MAIATKEKLAQVLHARGLFPMEKLARAGRYDDFESESATPIVDLVAALRANQHHDLVQRAMDGEWDATKEEAEAWAAGAEGRELTARLRREE